MMAQPGIARSIASALRFQRTQTRLFSAGRILADEENSKPLVRRVPTTGNRPAPKQKSSPRSRAVDARSLGAARGSSPTGPVLRASQLAALRSRLRRSSASSNKSNTKDQQAAKRERVRRARGEADVEEGEEARQVEIDAVFDEIREKNKPVPVRYTPVEYNAERLRETWPTLPMGGDSKDAQVSTVREKLSLLSERYPNGYEPPYVLAQRLYKGEHVLFTSEEEKQETMEEVRKLCQMRADQLTQRKGELIEPEDADFVPISKEDRETLVGKLVQGKYPSWKEETKGQSSLLAEVQRNLYNNSTYRMAGKQAQFMAKLESLLASGQRPKRA
ncbi:hypothetical protein VTN31DRAFT_7355 [Thermomyces dupontii]|uniref:uncharacterized protein n=1 Tax=Talaromyces thermophilus TaxID=28565 RepID=UPI0037420588